MKILQLIALMNDLFGSDWVDVEEPETLRMMLINKNIFVSEMDMDLINAIKASIVADSPWENIYVFENIVDAFNGDPVITNTVTKPPLENILYAITILNKIKPENEFSESIASYIAAVTMDTQLVIVPPPADFANSKMPRLDIANNIDELEDAQKSKYYGIMEILKNKLKE